MAFCTECGAQLGEGAAFCSNCGAKQGNQQQAQPQYAPQPQYVPQPQYTYAPQPAKQASSGVYGLGKAIASAILGVLSFMFAVVGLGFVLQAEEMSNYRHYNGNYYYYTKEDIGTMALGGYVGGTFAIVLFIISVIFGAISIKNFAYAKRELGTNPIATLILGIVGLAASALGLIFAFSAFSAASAVLN